MKRLILLLLVLCLSVPVCAFAAADTLEGTAITTSDDVEGTSGYDTLEGEEVASGAGDPWLDLLTCFNFENGSDEDTTYDAGAGDYCMEATAGYCDAGADGASLEADDAVAGSLGVDIGTGNTRFEFGITADDHWDDTQGTLAGWFTVDSFSDNAHLFTRNTTVVMGIVLDDESGSPQFRFSAQDGVDSMSNDGYIGSLSTRYFVIAYYDLSGGGGVNWSRVVVMNSACTQLGDTGQVIDSDDVDPVTVTDDDAYRVGGGSATARTGSTDVIMTLNSTTRTPAELCAAALLGCPKTGTN